MPYFSDCSQFLRLESNNDYHTILMRQHVLQYAGCHAYVKFESAQAQCWYPINKVYADRQGQMTNARILVPRQPA